MEPPELVLVDDVDVDELSAAGPLEDDSSVEVSDCADAVVTLVGVPLPKLDAPGPPPQAVRLVRTRASWARMGINVPQTELDVTEASSYRAAWIPAASSRQPVSSFPGPQKLRWNSMV